jgi:hypothetical protein
MESIDSDIVETMTLDSLTELPEACAGQEEWEDWEEEDEYDAEYYEAFEETVYNYMDSMEWTGDYWVAQDGTMQSHSEYMDHIMWLTWEIESSYWTYNMDQFYYTDEWGTIYTEREYEIYMNCFNHWEPSVWTWTDDYYMWVDQYEFMIDDDEYTWYHDELLEDLYVMMPDLESWYDENMEEFDYD